MKIDKGKITSMTNKDSKLNTGYLKNEKRSNEDVLLSQKFTEYLQNKEEQINILNNMLKQPKHSTKIPISITKQINILPNSTKPKSIITNSTQEMAEIKSQSLSNLKSDKNKIDNIVDSLMFIGLKGNKSSFNA